MENNTSDVNNLKADFKPSKRFFVSMLTRDIELNDAILDLLDNCVDGALRTKTAPANPEKPYQGFEAKLTINDDLFIIEDNCGGIPKSDREYAFRMGRPQRATGDDESTGTVGVYGIGMKRAIFKMGSNCTIDSNHKDGAFDIKISPSWISGEEWEIPLHEKEFDAQSAAGTKILIKDLHKNISDKFSETSYLSDLFEQIKHSLSFIIQKGFKISLNGSVVEANPITLISDGRHIEPYIYKAIIDDVHVDLAVGFYKNLEDDNDDDSESRRSAEKAGWTIICNDRVVLYCDKTHLTGWGFNNVPRFHTQFIAISGVVRFTSKTPEKLPITTTKRGVDLSSTLYNDVRNKMIEGMQIFMRFTNQWKGEHLEEGKKLLGNANSEVAQEYFKINPNSVKTSTGKWTNPNKNTNEWRFTPSLPTPNTNTSKTRITFSRQKEDIKILSNYFFGDDNASPADVGIKCFDTLLKEVK